MTRVATSFSNQALINNMLSIQKRLYATQDQVSTGKVSQNYQGISKDSFRLLNLENEVTQQQRYIKNNELASVKLKTMDTAVSSIEDATRNFRDSLVDFSSKDLSNPMSSDDLNAIEGIQNEAFRLMEQMSYYLNTKSNGEYLFAGGRTDTPPTTFEYDSLADFQSTYDGVNMEYPTTRAAHISDVKTDSTKTGNLTSAAGVITAANAGSLANFQVGSSITISGSGAFDGTYEVTATNGSDQLTLSPAPAAGGPVATGVSIAAETYYKGDELQTIHQIDEGRDLNIGINAKDPAFEKIWRAAGMLAQGDLENNIGRIQQALDLVNDGMSHPASSTEKASDLEDLTNKIGSNLNILDNTITAAKENVVFMNNRIGDIENVDKMEAVTRLNQDFLTLQVSMQAIGQYSQLSLANYI
jgi:flagellin-like hook-associated protein FlgL